MEDVASSGKCCILDIDVQGARLVRRSAQKAIFVFVAPPSTEALEQRLRGRGTESEEQVQERLQAAKEEIARYSIPCTLHLHDLKRLQGSVASTGRQASTRSLAVSTHAG